jgi:heme exporter protein B
MGRPAHTPGSKSVKDDAMPAEPIHSAWMKEAVALFFKDVQAELRSKVAASAVGVFTFSALLLMSLATAALKETQAIDVLKLPEIHLHAAWDPVSKMGMLWILLCFAAFTGLSHAFVHEEETGTVTALRLTMSPEAVYAGKLAFNLALIVMVALVVTPAYMLITGMPLRSPLVFIGVMAGGCLSLAAAATIVAVLAAKAHSTGALFAAIGLPLLVVFLMLLLNAANTVYTIDPPLVRVVKDVGGLFSYGILLIAVSALTFHFVWEE